MDLVNVQFVKLIIMISFCVVPGIVGLYLIFANRDVKREIKRKVCSALFDSSSVFTTEAFSRFLVIFGLFLLVFSLAASWYFILRQFI